MTRPVGSASSNSYAAAEKTTPFFPVRAGEAEPTGLHLITDPELRAAFMAAHYAWGKAKAPGLLQEWLA